MVTQPRKQQEGGVTARRQKRRTSQSLHQTATPQQLERCKSADAKDTRPRTSEELLQLPLHDPEQSPTLARPWAWPVLGRYIYIYAWASRRGVQSKKTAPLPHKAHTLDEDNNITRVPNGTHTRGGSIQDTGGSIQDTGGSIQFIQSGSTPRGGRSKLTRGGRSRLLQVGSTPPGGRSRLYKLDRPPCK